MQTVVETAVFSRRADTLLAESERRALITLLSTSPEDGAVIPGTGGIRKLRFAGDGRGKRGAFRVVYYVFNESLPVIALLIYAKNEQDDLTPDQKKKLSALAASFKHAAKGG
jgi:mRNA-degrading endonuclease RelE of RelBE toxin-antitoxin system